MDKASIEQLISDAGPGGRLTLRYREHMTPQFEGDGADRRPVKDAKGNVVHDHDAEGHIRTISGFPMRLGGALGELAIGIGESPLGPMLAAISLDEIDGIAADPAEHPVGGALTPDVVPPDEPGEVEPAPEPQPFEAPA